MRFLGIDPGLRLTGYACVEGRGGADPPALVEAGVLRLGKVRGRAALAPVPDRLVELDSDIRELIERLGPDAAAVEAVFAHYKHPATAIAMAHARGVILVNIRRAGLELLELKPNTVKKHLTGHGHASKTQMQESVRRRLNLAARPEPPDVADAIAIALCAAWRMQGVPLRAAR